MGFKKIPVQIGGVSFRNIKHFHKLLKSVGALSIQHLCKMYSTTIIQGWGRWQKGVSLYLQGILQFKAEDSGECTQG